MSAAVTAGQPSQRIAQQLLDFLSDIPRSREPRSEHPQARVEAIALAARRKAFLASSSLALPPGPLGWLTVLPELVAIWKIQAQMVADKGKDDPSTDPQELRDNERFVLRLAIGAN